MSFYKIFIYGIMVASYLAVSSCADLIEKDISKKSIVIFAPKDNIISTIYTINYWWDEIPGATKYRLQIVQTDSLFKDSLSLVIDTLVGKNQFRKSMNPGHYLWSVLGANGAYTSIRSDVRKLSIDSSTISGQDIQFIIPSSSSDTTFVNISPFAITWEALAGAKSYEINLDSLSTLRIVKNISSSSYAMRFGAEGDYKISVLAINGTLKSNTSPTSLLFYDKTPPDSVPLFYPLNNTNSTTDTTQSLKWYSAPDRSGISRYVVTITGTNKNFTSGPITVTSFPLSGLRLNSLSVYQWKVTATDKAGNSKESKTFSFKTR